MSSKHEKNWRSKISWHTPFKLIIQSWKYIVSVNLKNLKQSINALKILPVFKLLLSYLFKGSESQDFWLSFFFHDSNPSGPLINRLKYFRIRFRFRRDIKILKKLCSVHPTAESDSTECIILLSQTPWCASYRGVRLRGVHHTVESWKQGIWKNSAVCIPLQSQNPWCASYRRVSNLPSVCFDWKFYDCYISVMP